MSKFLTLIESLHPDSTANPKWELKDFLESKGVKVSVVRHTDMLYIDTGGKTIAITVSNKEEESQEGDLVSDIANDPTDKLNSDAKAVKQQSDKIAPQVIQRQKQRMTNLQKEIQSNPIQSY